jgi:hypothetical protein
VLRELRPANWSVHCRRVNGGCCFENHGPYDPRQDTAQENILATTLYVFVMSTSAG